MSFYLIYIDDFGNTGANIFDEQQKILMLFAAVIPAEKWSDLEGSYGAIRSDLARALGTEEFELKSSRFFSRHKKPFSKISLDERAQIVLRVATAFASMGARFIASYVDKQALIPIYTAVKEVYGNKIPGVDQYFNPYVIAYANLIARLDFFLDASKTRGLIIIDRQDQYEYLITSSMYTLMRKDGLLKRLVERPLRADSKEHSFIQAVDLLAGVYGRYLCNRTHGKDFPGRHSKTLDILRQKTEEAPAFLLNDAGQYVYSTAVAEALGIPGEQTKSGAMLLAILLSVLLKGVLGDK